jgi:GH24 family phage-related lysozyme (muramidase)
MLSDLLGLTIDKGDLNKSSPSPVVSTLKKTAINYLAIGKMANDLKLIRLNFSRWLAIEGIKVKGTPDAHFLKDDERSKKFNVLREKYLGSKISKASQDGTHSNKGWVKSLMEKYINYRVERPLERKLAAAALKKLKKLTWIRKFMKFKRKLLSSLKSIMGKLNVKKMFMDWFRKNASKIIKPVVKVFSNALKRFFTKGLQKLAVRFGTAFAASVAFSGPFAALIAAAVTVVLMVWDPLKDAWAEYQKGGDFFKTFIVGLMDEFSFGILGKENSSDIYDFFGKWYNNFFKFSLNVIDKSIQFIEEKISKFAIFIYKKVTSLFTNESTPSDFKSSFEQMNAKRMEEEAKQREKYAEYFQQMDEKIEQKKIHIRQLEIEIATLEYDIKSMAEGPEKANLEAAKVEKAKQEKEKTELEAETKRTREGGSIPVEQKTTPPKAEPKITKPATAPAVTPAPAVAPVAATPSPTSGKYENIKQMVIANEGWKNKPYKDSRGLWTVGVGHLIGDGKKLPKEYDREFSNQEIRILFEKDFAEHLKLAEKAPGWDKANEAGKAGLVDLTYNMGGYWYTKFKKAAALLGEGNFKGAADEFRNSAWYKQVKSRGPITLSLIRAGAASDKEGSAALASVTGSTKVAAAGKFLQDESTQVAQAQREQLKPKDANVVNVARVNNNKKVDTQTASLEKPKTDPGTAMANRVTA